jgi:hypothetical protein
MQFYPTFAHLNGRVAEWLGRALQKLVRRFVPIAIGTVHDLFQITIPLHLNGLRLRPLLS